MTAQGASWCLLALSLALSASRSGWAGLLCAAVALGLWGAALRGEGRR